MSHLVLEQEAGPADGEALLGAILFALSQRQVDGPLSVATVGVRKLVAEQPAAVQLEKGPFLFLSASVRRSPAEQAHAIR